jgi:ribose/xylose/arabinose/galactoside ABC-type transport system permease subunit
MSNAGLSVSSTTSRTSRRRLQASREYGVLGLLLLTIIVVQIVNRGFLSAGNILDMLIQCSPFAIMACGMTFVILTREIDISVGSMVGLLATVAGIACAGSRMGLPVWVAVLATCAAGILLGLANGVLVTYGRVPSIIVTLGMLIVLRGVTEILMAGRWITDLPDSIRYLGTGRALAIPVPVAVAVVVVALSILLARETPLGRWIYAVGSNPTAAAMRGLRVRRVKLFVFTLMGFLTAVATLVSVPRLSVIESGLGVGWELFVVTCVVVGGTSVSGGRGSIIGSVLGVLLLGIVRTVLIFLRLGDEATYWERAIQGVFILAAVLADRIGYRGADREVRP